MTATRSAVISGVLPTALLAAVIGWRIQWTYDIHPVQPVWIAWVAGMVLTSAMVALCYRNLWDDWRARRRRREAQRRLEDVLQRRGSTGPRA